MSVRVAEVKVSVITVDVPIQTVVAIFFSPFDVQEQTSTYVIYCWACGTILRQDLQDGLCKLNLLLLM